MRRKKLIALLAGFALSATLPVQAKNKIYELSRISFYKAGPKHNLAPSACGETIGPWQQVAVSQDLAEILPCGSLVTIILDQPVGGKKKITAVVWDIMHTKYQNSVDILVGQKEKAKVYGVATGQLKVTRPEQFAQTP